MKPSIPQGTRDFGPDIVRKREYIFSCIRKVFALHGFQPLETPAFENIETLMGKYGEEGDKLIFKILNNGLDRPEKHTQANNDFMKVLEGKNVKGITERALKYDLTIPFARYVAMHSGQINFPFKRYQIQNVWRADRPQRGRYREFTQCDADIVGSKSMLNEVDLIRIYQEVFSGLRIPVSICVNNRKILAALAEICGGMEQLSAITIAIDKLDKIGMEKVKEELANRGVNEKNRLTILQYLALQENTTSSKERLEALRDFFVSSTLGLEGIEELGYLIHYFEELSVDVTLARGLNYYTGSIFEVKPIGVQIGSIGGGGRYDDLTGLFGLPNIPGVGISFGVDRIFDVMEELQLFPSEVQHDLHVMLVNFGEKFEAKNMDTLQRLREEGLRCELYPDAVKFDKQLKYANKRGVQYIIMIGEDELKENIISLKNFETGEQKKLVLFEIIEQIKGAC